MNLSEKELGKLKKLIQVYMQAKALIIYAEEIDPDSKSNLQIIKELRDAFDHTMKVFECKFGREKDTSDFAEEYELENFEKAIGHVYRAAFDALDGTVLSLKEIIKNDLQGYSLEVITAVLPNYWEIKSNLYKLIERVGTHRGNKDTANDMSSVIDGYVEDVEELRSIHIEILENGKNFDEARKSQRNKGVFAWIERIVLVLITVIITTFANSMTCSTTMETPDQSNSSDTTQYRDAQVEQLDDTD